MRAFYHRGLQAAASPQAAFWLFIIAFAEASFFPIPIDFFLIPAVMARRDRAFFLASVTTLGSVSGGLVGWVIGALLLKHIALPIMAFYHAEPLLSSLQERFRTHGVALILLKGLTPIPYKVVTIAAGAAHFPLLPFLIASLITRGARFFLVAGLLRFYGAAIQHFIERRLPLLMWGFLFTMILGIVALKFF